MALFFQFSHLLQWVCIEDISTGTMMKPHFKGKTTSTKPIYSRKLIHPSCIEKHSACGRENNPQCLVCGIIVQLLHVLICIEYNHGDSADSVLLWLTACLAGPDCDDNHYCSCYTQYLSMYINLIVAVQDHDDVMCQHMRNEYMDDVHVPLCTYIHTVYIHRGYHMFLLYWGSLRLALN